MKAENANNPAVEVVLKTRLDAPERFEIPAQSDFDRWAAAALDAGADCSSAADSNANLSADPGVAGEAGVGAKDSVGGKARNGGKAAASAASPQPLEVCVVVIDADESAALNRRHFDRSKPTNVLAFPCDAPLPPDGGEAKPLGDVLITAPVVEAEAREQGKRPAAHWAHLFVHAMLHLQGYDHAEDDEAARMEAREITILGRLGFPNPYQPQTSGQSQPSGQSQTFSQPQPPAQPQPSGQPPGRSSDA